ncbi:major facilitator superfamily domain-containing protein [Mycena olivaceomarginata]|nr:major facilitator superfamily domain-containing protein [Mycena olivaceomarginata]
MKFRLGWPYFMSAFFAYALSLLGWAWIFIIEGAITIVFGIVGWRGTRCRTSSPGGRFVDAFDWRVWAYAFMFRCANDIDIRFFVNAHLERLGWSVSASLLLVCEVWIIYGISTVLFSRLSDHYRQRALFIAIQCATAIVGWCLTGFAPAGLWRYGGLFLSNAGSSGSVIGILAYSSNNIVSHSKRAIVSSVIISAGGVGGLLASSIFTQASAPRYLPGIVVTVISQVLLLGVLCAKRLSTFPRQTHGSSGNLRSLRASRFLYNTYTTASSASCIHLYF